MASQNPKKKPVAEKKAKIISFISGKGGVGKTAVAAGIADVLFQLGYSVLLVDLDLVTHGLSYFFMDQIQESGHPGISEKLQELEARSRGEKPEKPSPGVVVKLKDGPDIVASTSRFETGPAPTETEEPRLVSWTELARLIGRVRGARPRYDYIVFDTQAGATPSTYAAVRSSDVVVTVMEPDPVCMWATRIAERRLSTAFARAAESFYLGNKLFFEEVEQYQAITKYLRGFAHLPPLPFDMQVRYAFLRRLLPTRWEGGSAFVFGIARMLKDMLPEIRTKIEAFEDEKRREIFGPAEEELKSVDREIDETRSEIQYVSRRTERLGLIILALTVPVLAGLLLRFMLTGEVESMSMVNIVLMLVGTFGGLLALVAVLMSLFPIRRALFRLLGGPVREKDVLVRTLDDLLERRRKLHTLLETRSEELMFPREHK